MLYPRDSESRQVKVLDGMWNFLLDTSPSRDQSFANQWWKRPLAEWGSLIPMAVPSSYNDITSEKSVRDFVGWAWYETTFYVPAAWKELVVSLRFGSAHYNTVVWVNGEQVMTHEGGHLPFEASINSAVNWEGAANRLTVAINNTLTPTTLPPGSIKWMTGPKYPAGYFQQNLQMDFFNYAGIHRHVHLYTRPTTYVDDINIVTDFQGTQGTVNYEVMLAGTNASGVGVKVSVLDAGGKVVSSGAGTSGQLIIPDVNLWWPYTETTGTPAYMYTLEVTAGDDVYRQPFGVRTVKVAPGQLMINNKPFYCHGVAKHEDADIRGKGLDYPLIARDFNMLKWLGANCFRTSHYPYAEEIMDQADQQGIVIIDESPGVGIRPNNMGEANVAHHKAVMEELVRRDKNRPSTVIWSVANEPSSDAPGAEDYFREVINHTRSVDPAKRPVTFVSSRDYNTDRAVQYVDVICVNRYFGWYSDTGHSELVELQLGWDLEMWRKTFPTKPIIITEYGAGTIPGLHMEPAVAFTEDYQVELMAEYHKTFDKYRGQFLTGEMVWNFADFMTDQSAKRVVGNKKGVLTRQRQPKEAAHLLRDRYYSIINATTTTKHAATVASTPYRYRRSNTLP
ncbi:hypothetical protein BaRGS_00011571 [Batillaria attramentaria]|uniref:Beta-glucuronidase n=1 Tax=Batillaria attramentaria TaxID=370345 RepID=A0ABD0LE57_9CAEN